MRERHLNNEQLAVALSLELGEAVSNSTVSRWLNGEVGPQSDVVVALAKILGFPRAYLLDLSAGGDGAPAPLEQQLAIVLQQQQQMAARLHELERQARK
jgi:transcriptional regulator with XRE-family HTH domain